MVAWEVVSLIAGLSDWINALEKKKMGRKVDIKLPHSTRLVSRWRIHIRALFNTAILEVINCSDSIKNYTKKEEIRFSFDRGNEEQLSCS